MPRHPSAAPSPSPSGGRPDRSHATDYVPFAHAHALLRERLGDPRRVDVPALAAHLGMRNLPKLRRRLAAWAEAPGKVPRALLDYIGLELDDLRAAVARDHEAWQVARAHVGVPDGFVTRVLPGFYPGSAFPPEVTTWDEAFEFLALLTELEGLSHLMRTDTVSAVFWPGSPPFVSELAPRLVVWKTEVRFVLGDDPRRPCDKAPPGTSAF